MFDEFFKSEKREDEKEDNKSGKVVGATEDQERNADNGRKETEIDKISLVDNGVIKKSF